MNESMDLGRDMFVGKSLRDLFELPQEYLTAHDDGFDAHLVSVYAEDIIKFSNIDEVLAYDVALETFLSDPIIFRNRIGGLYLPIVDVAHADELCVDTKTYEDVTIGALKKQGLKRSREFEEADDGVTLSSPVQKRQKRTQSLPPCEFHCTPRRSSTRIAEAMSLTKAIVSQSTNKILGSVVTNTEGDDECIALLCDGCVRKLTLIYVLCVCLYKGAMENFFWMTWD